MLKLTLTILLPFVAVCSFGFIVIWAQSVQSEQAYTFEFRQVSFLPRYGSGPFRPPEDFVPFDYSKFSDYSKYSPLEEAELYEKDTARWFDPILNSVSRFSYPHLDEGPWRAVNDEENLQVFQQANPDYGTVRIVGKSSIAVALGETSSCTFDNGEGKTTVELTVFASNPDGSVSYEISTKVIRGERNWGGHAKERQLKRGETNYCPGIQSIMCRASGIGQEQRVTVRPGHFALITRTK